VLAPDPAPGDDEVLAQADGQDAWW
jgi:hypothetical protein